jgi:hypothetical protein
MTPSPPSSTFISVDNALPLGSTVAFLERAVLDRIVGWVAAPPSPPHRRGVVTLSPSYTAFSIL